MQITFSLHQNEASVFNLFVGNGLISMYAKCNAINDVSLLFKTTKNKDTVTLELSYLWFCGEHFG